MRMENVKIYIDPGHGAGDPGAPVASAYKGIYEHEVTVKVGNQVASLLQSYGAMVKVRDVSDAKFKDTYKIAEDSINWGSNIFLSIHCNSSEYTAAYGTETYTQRGTLASNYEKDLAQRIQSAIVNTLGTYDRGIKETNWNVFNNQSAWSILTELLFIDNINDVKIAKDDSKLSAVSRSIALAIRDFVLSLPFDIN